MAKLNSKRVCLSGGELAKLLRGEAITAYGTEFVFDGTEDKEIVSASEEFKKNLTFHQTHDTIKK